MHEVFKMHFLNQMELNKEKWKEGGREKQEKLSLFILNFIIAFCLFFTGNSVLDGKG